MKAEITEYQKRIARKTVQYEYSQLTGESHINSQGEPDIDYVEYLENLVSDMRNYARIQIEKDRDRVKDEFRDRGSLTVHITMVLRNTPHNLRLTKQSI